MAQVKTNLRDLTIPQKIQRGRDVETGLRNNPNLPDGDALADAIKTKTDQLSAANTDQRDKKQIWSASVQVQETRETEWNTLYVSTGNKVEVDCGGDAAKILSTRYEVRDEPGVSQPMPKVEHLTATTGDAAGELDLHWDSVDNAQSYAAQICIGDAPVETAWQYAPPLGRKSSATLKGLTSGTRYWIRVQAVGALGTGPFSDPVARVAP